jgi:hypothetical protein
MGVAVCVSPPPFFVLQTDYSFKGSFFPPGPEAERRISFFAQSLTTALPEALPIDAMPTVTVLTPHYNERVCYLFYRGHFMKSVSSDPAFAVGDHQGVRY